MPSADAPSISSRSSAASFAVGRAWSPYRTTCHHGRAFAAMTFWAPTSRAPWRMRLMTCKRTNEATVQDIEQSSERRRARVGDANTRGEPPTHSRVSERRARASQGPPASWRGQGRRWICRRRASQAHLQVVAFAGTLQGTGGELKVRCSGHRIQEYRYKGISMSKRTPAASPECTCTRTHLH